MSKPMETTSSGIASVITSNTSHETASRPTPTKSAVLSPGDRRASALMKPNSGRGSSFGLVPAVEAEDRVSNPHFTQYASTPSLKRFPHLQYCTVFLPQSDGLAVGQDS